MPERTSLVLAVLPFLQGMIAAQLVTTVIRLTNEPGRQRRYQDKLPELLKIKEDIQKRLYPTLENLFREDSDLFDKVIRLRNERDSIDLHKDWALYIRKQRACHEALRQATELPIQTARNCYELRKYAGFVFKFMGLRGQEVMPGVGLQGAIAAMASCIQVIDLNLTTLPLDKWMATIRPQRGEVKDQYLEIEKLGKAKIAILEEINERNWHLEEVFGKYRKGALAETIRTEQDIEELVRKFQNLIWSERENIWKDGITMNEMQILNPPEVLKKVMRYNYSERESLGMFTFGGSF